MEWNWECVQQTYWKWRPQAWLDDHLRWWLSNPFCMHNGKHAHNRLMLVPFTCHVSQQVFMNLGYFRLFCCFDVIRWLAWRGSTKSQALLVGSGFVAVNSELHDSFNTWRVQDLSWSDENGRKAWIPYNQAVEKWWGVSHSEPTRL